MKKLLIAAIVLGVVYFAKQAYDNAMHVVGDVTGVSAAQENRTLEGFNGIASYIAADIEWRRSEVFSFQIDAPSDVLAKISTKVEGDVLEIKTNEDIKMFNQTIKIRVSSPDLRQVHLHGSGDFVSKSPIQRANFKANLAGSGNIILEALELDNFDANLGGSGTITASGMAGVTEILLGGSGTYEGKNLKSDHTKATLAGSGTIDCNAQKVLEANLLGSGNINYSGAPTVVANKVGSGNIERIGG